MPSETAQGLVQVRAVAETELSVRKEKARNSEEKSKCLYKRCRTAYWTGHRGTGVTQTNSFSLLLVGTGLSFGFRCCCDFLNHSINLKKTKCSLQLSMMGGSSR